METIDRARRLNERVICYILLRCDDGGLFCSVLICLTVWGWWTAFERTNERTYGMHRPNTARRSLRIGELHCAKSISINRMSMLSPATVDLGFEREFVHLVDANKNFVEFRVLSV